MAPCSAATSLNHDQRRRLCLHRLVACGEERDRDDMGTLPSLTVKGMRIPRRDQTQIWQLDDGS
jgi:hypothetical protein